MVAVNIEVTMPTVMVTAKPRTGPAPKKNSIREEAHNGRTPLNAMEVGFKRAYSTIIDSNMTAFLAHVMLFFFGAGPVRGFAVTITVGIVTSLFTATMVARMMMVRWYVARRPAALPV